MAQKWHLAADIPEPTPSTFLIGSRNLHLQAR